MRQRFKVSVLWFVGAALCSKALAAEDLPNWPAPNWQTEQALTAAKSTATNDRLARLKRTLAADPDSLVYELQALAVRDDLSWPVREAAMMQFVQFLGNQKREQIPAGAMLFLSKWQPRTRIAHEESSEHSAPLYPIAAHAQGLQNRWQRESAQAHANTLLRHDVSGFLDEWRQATDAAMRAGFLDAIAAGDRGAQTRLLSEAQTAIAAQPEFAIPAAHAASALHDINAITALIGRGVGAETRALLQTCSDLLSSNELSILLITLRRDAAAPTVALAIGVWSGKLAGNTSAESQLLDLLGDRDLGSSAALALSLKPSPAALAELQSLAAVPDTSVRAARARLALQLDQIAELPR